jgi:hypothetical protein
MDNCKPRSTPCEMKLELNSNGAPTSNVKYRDIIGGLIYAMTYTRPDLCWIVTLLSQHLANPSDKRCVVLKHVLRYLKGSLNYELCFRESVDGLKLIGYSDATWDSCDDRKSIPGYCFSSNKNGPHISWESKKQCIVALSSCEAEFMALAATTQESLFLTPLLHDIDNRDRYESATLFGDNQGAIALVKNPVHHQRSKHIDIKYHFVRDEYSRGKIDIVYLPSEQMVADIFTKPASKFKLDQFRDFMFGKL